MATELVRGWYNNLEKVPPTHVIPSHERPSGSVPIDKNIPVIDLSQDRAIVVQQIMKACNDYAGFQVINHGVSKDLMDEAMSLYKEFFDLSYEEKAKHAEKAKPFAHRGAALYTGRLQNNGTQQYRYWRDILEHPCSANGEDEETWPDNPPRYRDVIRAYSNEVRKLSKVVLGLLGEGLGLESGFFDKDFGMAMHSSYYPICPDPSLTLGTGEHCDPNLITLLQQSVYGLQILKDGKWVGVDPIPYAFFVNAGSTLTVVSNGKLASVVHRVVTNSTQPRITLGTFIYPGDLIEPAKALIGPSNPPVYRSFSWRAEFMPHFAKHRKLLQGVIDVFKIDA